MEERKGGTIMQQTNDDKVLNTVCFTHNFCLNILCNNMPMFVYKVCTLCLLYVACIGMNSIVMYYKMLEPLQ